MNARRTISLLSLLVLLANACAGADAGGNAAVDAQDVTAADATEGTTTDALDETATDVRVETGADPADDPATEVASDTAADGTTSDPGTQPTTCDVDLPDRTVGLRTCKDGVEGGYVLYPAKHRGDVYLIDRLGRAVHHWSKSQYEPGQSCYLPDNGNLVRAAMLKGASNIGGGEGGRIEEYDWDDNLVWSFDYATNDYSTHHDFKILPTGNLLMLAVERKDKTAAGAVGFDTTKLQDGYVAPEKVIEVKKTGATTFEVVWEWHVWDHLIQNQSASLANYGDPAGNPGRLQVKGGAPAFWNHANSIHYNPDLDQIVISARSHNELWIIDHSTSTAQAATREGGTYGKGGDFLYRWGNPQEYNSGDAGDRRLFNQHDAQWIEPGLPGAGHILIFNNGLDRPGGNYSSLDEMIPPVQEDGSYPALAAGEAWGPTSLAWTFVGTPPESFYGSEISGTQRLPNGNTLACEGTTGRFFEVTPTGDKVWEYVNPIANAGPMQQYELAALDPKTHPENAVFKVHWYPADFAGFAGRDLTPGAVIEGSDTTCQVDNPNYTCKAAADCTAAGGADVSAHFGCEAGGICCFKLTQQATPPKP